MLTLVIKLGMLLFQFTDKFHGKYIRKLNKNKRRQQQHRRPPTRLLISLFAKGQRDKESRLLQFNDFGWLAAARMEEIRKCVCLISCACRRTEMLLWLRVNRIDRLLFNLKLCKRKGNMNFRQQSKLCSFSFESNMCFGISNLVELHWELANIWF